MNQPTRIFDFLYHQLERYPMKESVGGKTPAGWKFYSTQEIVDGANKVSRGLIGLGLKPGDKIAVAAYQNRPEFTMLDFGAQQAGVILVPLYPTISPAEYVYIMNDATIKYAFVGQGDLFEKIEKAKVDVPSFIETYVFDEKEGQKHWSSIFTDEHADEVERRKAATKPEDLATLIYTSGTTGKPKGVMLSHENIVSNAMLVQDLLPTNPGDTALSFLPLCHVFERTASISYIYCGLRIAYTGTDNLGGESGDLQAIKPHFFTTVPRLLEKVYEKIYNKGLDLTGIKRKLFFWALDLTDDYEYDKSYSGLRGFQHSIADKLIYSKWREALGGNIKGILTGAAPCPTKMARVFSAAGVPIREGYGLTETSPGLVIGGYKKDEAMLGTIGRVLPGIELKIDASDGSYRDGEGEILAKGPNIMMGYYNKPKATADVISEKQDGRWFHTGDVGKFVDGPGGNKFLRITDRKKELLKTSGGKYVAPAPIESKMKEDFLVEQIMVVGDKRKFVSALIVPAEEALKDWCENCGKGYESMESAINDPEVLKKYQEIINEVNPNFSHIEQIKKFVLLPCTWDAVKEDGSEAELTPTMKLKRRVIREKFNNEIEGIYS